MYHFGTDHAECNVHTIQYLRKNAEETGNHWSNEMTTLLCGMNQASIENNISERDLRKAKNQQKMAGGFWKESGHWMYCSILTVIEALKRRDMGILENIRQLFMETPAIF